MQKIGCNRPFLCCSEWEFVNLAKSMAEGGFYGLISGLVFFPVFVSAAENTTNSAMSLENTCLAVLSFVVLVVIIIGTYILVRQPIIKSRFLKTTQCDAAWLAAIEALDEPIFLVDRQDRLLSGNRLFYELIGRTPAEARGAIAAQFFHSPGEEQNCQVCQARATQHETVISLDASDPHNYSDKPMEARIHCVKNVGGKAQGMLQQQHSVSVSDNTYRQLLASEEKFRSILEATPDPLIISTSEGKITLVNKHCERVFGYRPEELIGQHVEILLPESMHGRHVKLRKNYSEQPKVRPLDKGDGLIVKHKDGHIIPVEISLSPWSSGDDLLISSAIRDVSERKQNERDLKRLASFLQLSPIPVFEMDSDVKVSLLNPRAEALFPELTKSDSFHPVLQGISEIAEEAKKTGKVKTRIVELRGAVYEQQLSYIAEIDMYHVYLWDITAIQKFTEKMSYQASHDGLTGLINRTEFEHRIKEALRDVELEDKTHAFCFVDLDRFKIVNDQCGHPAGDELLSQLAGVLKTEIRDSDTLARLGGDEFGLLLNGCDQKKAEGIAEQLRQVITDYRYLYDRKTYSVGASIGLVILKNGCGTLKQVMQAADSACYMAKREGRDRIHVFKEGDKVLAEHTEYVEWAQRILDALENNRFVLYAQTIHSLRDERDTMQEILVRMVSHEGELIPPGAFLPAAQRYSLMQSIDRWVIQHTFDAIQNGWLTPRLCSINLSGESISDPTILAYVIEKFAEFSIQPDKICFEITETALASNISYAKRFISTLKGIGCQFALDDFGSGVSSFTYLQSLAVDILKIDGRLVRGIKNNKVNEVMVRSINEIGHTMNMKTVAEFVENEMVMEKLREMGVDYGQGYYYSRPEAIIRGRMNEHPPVST